MLIAAPPWCSSAILACVTPDRSPSHRADVRTVSSKEPKGPAPPRALPHRFVALRCQSKHRGIAPRFHNSTLAIGRLAPTRSIGVPRDRSGAVTSQDGLARGRDLISPGGQRQATAGLVPLFLDRQKGPRRMSERSERVRPGTTPDDRVTSDSVHSDWAPIRRPSSPRSGVFSYGGKRDVQSGPASEAQPERHQPQLYASFFPS